MNPAYDDDDHYDVIDDVDVTKDSSSGTPGRSLPPLPTSASINHDGYTRLNLEHTGRDVDDAMDYEKFIDAVFEESLQNDRANCVSGPNRYLVPSITVDGVGSGEDVIPAVPRVEDSLHGEGSDTGDCREVEEVSEGQRAEKGYRTPDGGGDESPGLDRNGYLMLHHVPSPKNVRKADDTENDRLA